MPDLIKPSGKNPVPINGTTYEIELPLGAKAEIGDKFSADFKPNLKLKRWGEECSIDLSVPTTEKILPTIQADKILWHLDADGTSNIKLRMGRCHSQK